MGRVLREFDRLAVLKVAELFFDSRMGLLEADLLA